MRELIFRRRTIVMLLLAVFTVTEVVLARVIPFGPNFDEWEHYSLVRQLRERPELLPDPWTSRKLAPDGMSWSDATSHLAHPPAYHALAALVPADGKGLRLVSLILVTGALVGFAAFTLGRFPGVIAPAVAVGVLAASSPLAVAGALVTNDSLAFACGVAVAIGMVRWSEGGGWRWLALAAVALAVAGWTKLIAALLLFVFAAVMVLAGRRRAGLAALALAGAVAAIPYVVNLLRFGQLVFPGHLFIGHHGALPPMGLGAWAAAFVREMVSTGMALSGVSADPLRVLAAAVLAAGPPLAALACLASRRAIVPAAAVLAAVVATLAVHLHYTHAVSLAVGLTPHHAGAHARLYLAILPAAALLAGHLADIRTPPARWAAAALLAVLALGSLPATILRRALLGW